MDDYADRLCDHFPGRLKELMDRKGVTPTELARKTGFKQPYIWKLRTKEGGKNPPLRTVVKIAVALGVTVDALLVKPEKVPDSS